MGCSTGSDLPHRSIGPNDVVMFTGLVETLGVVVAVEDGPDCRRIVVDPQGWSHAPEMGSSIAVDGCCLTVATAPGSDGLLAFDAVPETLAKTTLGERLVGDRVHLEHAVTPTTLMGGHLMQGHVDGVGRVVSAGPEPDGGVRVRIELDGELAEFLTPKGSVTVAGVSLTIADLDARGGWFEVALIPTTLTKTTLGGLGRGDQVNLEMDMLAKTVVYWLRNFGGR